MLPIENNFEIKRSENSDNRRCPRCGSPLRPIGTGIDTKTNKIQGHEVACVPCQRIFKRVLRLGLYSYQERTATVEEKAKLKARADADEERKISGAAPLPNRVKRPWATGPGGSGI